MALYGAICATIAGTENISTFRMLIIVAWKGGHGLEPWHQVFTVGPVQTIAHVALDLGVLLIALGLRRRLFKDFSTLDELLAGDTVHIRWKDEVLNAPVFVAAGPAGLSIEPSVPMVDNGVRSHLRLIADLVGLGGSTELATTPYVWRRAAASRMKDTSGDSITKYFLNHSPSTDSLGKSYDNSVQQLDLGAATLQGERSSIVASANDAPALYRDAARVIEPLILEQCAETSEDIRNLLMVRLHLQAQIKASEDEWDIIKPYLTDKEVETACDMETDLETTNSGEEEDTICGTLLISINKRIKGHLARTQSNWQRHSRQQLRDDGSITLAQIAARRIEAAEKSAIVGILSKAVEDYQKDVDESDIVCSLDEDIEGLGEQVEVEKMSLLR
ncbi:hypothetical protein BJ138DRAFT_1108225, partial [Hygrophoropsis aurantiaca]